ncbi:MAG: hypothetical protein JWO44_360 [Bacteroidetes bacterium]|nr:hypothetical protein [Bacteroidota bacterium]
MKKPGRIDQAFFIPLSASRILIHSDLQINIRNYLNALYRAFEPVVVVIKGKRLSADDKILRVPENASVLVFKYEQEADGMIQRVFDLQIKLTKRVRHFVLQV